ncbi:MAG: hypothetical protein NT140_04630 [Deltaproteobacteria bacterium]|nr:hypothetical protein [Deltaproteobacteria bacterium]
MSGKVEKTEGLFNEISDETKGELESALFQLHGLAGLLQAAAGDYDSIILDVTNPLETLADIIREKTAFCLKALGSI